MLNKNKIFFLESLRGIAAICVALFHFQGGSFITENPFIRNAWLMVDFFFVLSGFVIAYNYQDQLKSVRDCYIFQIKRFLRLYPLHLFMLFTFLIIEFGKYFLGIYFGIQSNVEAFSINNHSSFMLNLLLLHNIFDGTLTWNGPSWSISSEFYTYILFALLTLYFYKNRYLYFAITTLIILTAFMMLYFSDMTANNGFLRCIYSFFLGVCVYHLSKFFNFRCPSFMVYVILFFTFISICFSEGEKIIGINIFIPILFGILILSLNSSPDDILLKRFLNNKYLIRLGTISYGIYMIHMAVWWGIIQSLRFIFLFPTITDERGMVEVLIEGQFLSSSITIFGISVIIFLAHLSYERLEKPLNNLRKKIN